MKAQLARDPLKMDIQLARVTLKNQKKKKQTKNFEKGQIKKKAFLYESSLGEIRLMTRPCIRSRHVTVQMSFGQARQTHKFKKLCFTWLKCIEIISLFW